MQKLKSDYWMPGAIAAAVLFPCILLFYSEWAFTKSKGAILISAILLLFFMFIESICIYYGRNNYIRLCSDHIEIARISRKTSKSQIRGLGRASLKKDTFLISDIKCYGYSRDLNGRSLEFQSIYAVGSEVIFCLSSGQKIPLSIYFYQRKKLLALCDAIHEKTGLCPVGRFRQYLDYRPQE